MLSSMWHVWARAVICCSFICIFNASDLVQAWEHVAHANSSSTTAKHAYKPYMPLALPVHVLWACWLSVLLRVSHADLCSLQQSAFLEWLPHPSSWLSLSKPLGLGRCVWSGEWVSSMELITLPQWHGAEAGGLNGGWFLQHRSGQGVLWGSPWTQTVYDQRPFWSVPWYLDLFMVPV